MTSIQNNKKSDDDKMNGEKNIFQFSWVKILHFFLNRWQASGFVKQGQLTELMQIDFSFAFSQIFKHCDLLSTKIVYTWYVL